MDVRAVLLISATCAALAGCKLGDPNDKPTYAASGLPVNCRALIAENIKGWRLGRYSPQEALESIDRNCGGDGYNWGR
jgi:hypothetical protein